QLPSGPDRRGRENSARSYGGGSSRSDVALGASVDWSAAQCNSLRLAQLNAAKDWAAYWFPTPFGNPGPGNSVSAAPTAGFARIPFGPARARNSFWRCRLDRPA